MAKVPYSRRRISDAVVRAIAVRSSHTLSSIAEILSPSKPDP